MRRFLSWRSGGEGRGATFGGVAELVFDPLERGFVLELVEEVEQVAQVAEVARVRERKYFEQALVHLLAFLEPLLLELAQAEFAVDEAFAAREEVRK